MAVIQTGNSGFGPTMPRGNWVSGPVPLNHDIYINRFGGATVYDPATNTAWNLQNTAMVGDYQSRFAAQPNPAQVAADVNQINFAPQTPVLAPPPLPLPPVGFAPPDLKPQDLGAPPPAAPLPPAAPSINAPPPTSALPPVPPPPPVQSFADPIVNLQNMQANASQLAPPAAVPPPAASGPPPDSGLPPPMPGIQQLPIQPPAQPTQPGTGGTPVAPQTIGESVTQTAQDLTPPVQTGEPVGNTAIPGTSTGMQGLAPQAGGPSSAQFSPLAPPGDEGPQPIPFNPNTPRPVAPSLIGNDVEGFPGDLSQLQFGPEGILGAPGGQRRAQGQTEADFLKQLLSQGLFGTGL